MFKQFLVSFVTFLAIDGIWLSAVAKGFYAKHLGFIMSKTPNLTAAGIFYLIYVATLVILVIAPEMQSGTLKSVVAKAALFGFCAYATYDLTNLATIKNWPIIVTVVDLIWGTVLTAVVAGISYWILTKW